MASVTGSTTGAYIARLDLDQPHLLGVAKKVDAQIAALTEAFGPVETWFLRGLTVERSGEVVWRQPPGPLARQRLHALKFYQTVQVSPSASRYIYIRYQRCTPAFLTLLARLKTADPKRPILVEVPTYPYEAEQLTPRERLLGLVDRLTRGEMKRYVDRIVTFSGATEIFGIPTIQTDNGVDTDLMPPPGAPPAEGPVRLVGVANLGLRHAYDRVIDGLADYRASGAGRAVVFDIVGSGSEEPALRASVAARGIGDLVTFCGPMNGKALSDHLATCHIGVSALGMHRISADTSDIKSREYCARGLPFVTANADRDFGPDFPFAFHAPADETPVDIAGLLAFHDALRAAAPDYPARMRAYAEVNLTWRAKMAPVVAALRDLLGDDA